MVKIFISYSTKNSSFADRLANDLKELNANIFYDKWSIKVGDSIVEKISNALSSHDILLVLLSPESVKSDWVKKEINSSMMRQLATQQIKILPVLIEQCNIPFILSDIKYANFTDKYRAGLEQVVSALEDDFNLVEFENIVREACSELSAEKDIKEVAIHLKKNIYMTFFRSSIFSSICGRGKISEEELLFQYDERKEIFDEIIPLVGEELLVKTYENEILYYQPSKLGEFVYKALIHAYNSGMYAPTCSS